MVPFVVVFILQSLKLVGNKRRGRNHPQHPTTVILIDINKDTNSTSRRMRRSVPHIDPVIDVDTNTVSITTSRRGGGGRLYKK